MRSTLLIPSLVALALVAAPAASLAQTETETVEKTLRLPANGTLSLKTFSGDVTITGHSGNDVIIKAVRRATRDRLDHIKLDITESGSTISINANKRDEGWKDKKNNVVETTFDIQVPTSAKLDIDGFSSDVSVVGVVGDQELKTFSGKLASRGARGAVDLTTFSGSIEVDLTAAGAEPDIEAETFSGTIEARLASNARGSIDFNSFSGSFDSDLELANRSSSKKRVKGDLPGGSGETLKFKTFSGALRLVK